MAKRKMPDENRAEHIDYMMRKTWSLTAIDIASISLLGRKLNKEIASFDAANKPFSYTFIFLIFFSVFLQVTTAILIILSNRYETPEHLHHAFSLNDIIVISVLTVIVLNTLIFSFERVHPETSMFRANTS